MVPMATRSMEWQNRPVTTKVRRIWALSRRKPRHWAPDVLNALRDELATGASARRVLDKLELLQVQGELHDENGQPLDLPSIRTVQSIAREQMRDDSGEWQLTDSSPGDVGLVLRVLASVIERSEGRIQTLTKREAELIPSIYHAGAGRLTPWVVFLLARFYLQWVAREPDHDLVTYLAFVADPVRLRRNIARGWISDRNILGEVLRWSQAGDDAQRGGS